MKQTILMILVALLLCGCGTQPISSPTTPSTPTPIATPMTNHWQTADVGLEQYTPEGETTAGLCLMGTEPVLFCGTERTTLIKLDADTMTQTAITQLDLLISADAPSVQVSDKGVTYYDAHTAQLVFLDTSLREVSRMDLPNGVQAPPVLSADRKYLYYCAEDSLRVLDLETGLDRLLKEMHWTIQEPLKLLCDDTLVVCRTVDAEGNALKLFISTQNGETRWESPSDTEVFTDGDVYFAVSMDGAYRELLYGSVGTEPQALAYDGFETDATPILNRNGVVLSAWDDERAGLEYYDLTTGQRIAALEIAGNTAPGGFCADESGWIYFLCGDSVYRWKPEDAPLEDDGVYLVTRYTHETPDLEGLAQCQALADEISQRHEVQILLWEDGVSAEPRNYTLEAEYQVPLILDCLEQLDQAMGQYPNGFLKKTALGTDSGILRICLVRGIYGNADAGTLSSVPGVQFWDEQENAYLCLAAGADLTSSFHHELFHVIDNRVLGTSNAYDDWEKLNPDDFTYDNNYLLNQVRTDLVYLDGTQRAFVDQYAMSFATEDRAMIMEYAMMDGNEELFQLPMLQKKLAQLCQGIRQTFSLEASEQTYRWEQYLQ